jgi:hypothetical protein
LLDYDRLKTKSEKALQDLTNFLCQKFRMHWLSSDDIKAGVKAVDVEALAEKLAKTRPNKNFELSSNDALMVYAVYAQRRTRKESAIHDGLGMRTWWLTKETAVLAHTGSLVHESGGVPYIMRPEFLLNFVVLAPKAADARSKFKELLPTTVGLQLGHHLPSSAMDKMLASVEEWSQYPPERISVLLADKANRLIQDRFKQYVDKLS